MTHDNDDLLAQVFSVIPTLEGHTDINTKQEENIVSNIHRVSNAHHDFIESSGIVETNLTLENHMESHYQVTTHIETHHETFQIGEGVQVQHKEHHEKIGFGATIEEHHEQYHNIDQSVEHHKEFHGIGSGASVISTELNPPRLEQSVTVGNGAAPRHDDDESVVSVRTGLSEATSVSVHSSVSQKSAQVFTDAPVIQMTATPHSVVSHKSSIVPESHHSEIAHTHDKESTISTLTGSDASKNTAIEKYTVAENEPHLELHHHLEVHHHHHASQDSTPIAPSKSAPHDALIQEFKERHGRAPSEVSSIVVAPVHVPPQVPIIPPPTESDEESDVVMTVKVTKYAFDSNEVTSSVEHHHENHNHVHEEHQYNHSVYQEPIKVHHEEEYHYEHYEYPEHHEVHNQFESQVPPVFFNSPVIVKKTPIVQNHYDSGEDIYDRYNDHDSTIHRELIPNVSGPHVRDELRPAHVSHGATVTVVKNVSAPVAHVSPVVTQQGRGLPRMDHRESYTAIVEAPSVVLKHVEHEYQQYHHDEDSELEHHHHHTHEDKHYHKYDEQVDEVISGPSVKDLKSRFEHGGHVEVYYGTHYISHKAESPVNGNQHKHEHHHHHHHHHHETVHIHQEEPVHVHHAPEKQPRLPLRETRDADRVIEHHHHHEPHLHHHGKEVEHHHHHHHHAHEHQHLEQTHEDHHHHEDGEHAHHQAHHHSHQHVVEEEEQQPVSFLLNLYGGGAKLRRPDHVEEIKVYSRSSSVHNFVHEHSHHEEQKPRSVTQSSVTTTASHQTSHRSRSSTLTQNQYNIQAAPVAAARNTSGDHQSLRVVKSVRKFVSEWGQKDFQPPMSPVIVVPRLPSSPKDDVVHTYPEAVSRRSTVVSTVSHTTNGTHVKEEHAVHKITNVVEEERCTQSKRQSVGSVASTANTNYGVTTHEGTNFVGLGAHPQVPEVHEEFILTPLAERRAKFEKDLSRGYSINRKNHGELRPMVNVFTD